METYSRLQSELFSARERVTKFQQEAAAQRLVQSGEDKAFWRKRLAAQLHGLANRIEPTPYTPKGELA